jgi:segregation and condensation protein B
MELKHILESILFTAQKPLTPKELRDLLGAAAEHGDEARPFKKTKEKDIEAALEQLRAEHETAARSYRLACVAGSWQFFSQPEYAPWVIATVGLKSRPPRLSQPALETLAIIAYRQPITRADIEAVRGVAVDGMVGMLLERGLVRIAGRAEVPGRPLLYESTEYFLQHFGLKTLDELPNSSELRRIPLPIAQPAPTSEAAPEQEPTPAATAEPQSDSTPSTELPPAPDPVP